jgi:alpha-D-ribose 1-methylphosphonate 5-triphosphate diphosphatase
MRKCILNAVVVGTEELMPEHAVVISDDTISSVIPMNALNDNDSSGEETVYFNAHGGYVMPGFIDIHSDYIEGLIQPRPTSVMDFEISLREAEKQLLGHGITTIFHSLSIMEDAGLRGGKTFRTQENWDKLVGLIRDFHEGRHLIRHRVHARYEISNLCIYDHLTEMISGGMVHELSFMDHTPGQGQYRDLEIYAKSIDGWTRDNMGMSAQEFIRERQSMPVATHGMLTGLSELARSRGIPLASHDDDTEEKAEFMRREYGAVISEFPVELSVARRARELGMSVVVGAPNIILGGSHSGNLSASEAISSGCADIMCSDYYPASLLHAAFRLESDGILTLPQAVKMLTLNPAEAMGIGGNFGSVEAGKKADLLVVRKIRGCPLVYKCFVDGRNVVKFEYRKG